MRAALKSLRLAPSLLAALLACAYLPQGHAALFEDDEARRAILELRQRVDVLNQSSQRSAEELRKLIPAAFEARPATRGEIVWLFDHAKSRGLPGAGSLGAPVRDAKLRTATALINPVLDEGGQSDLEGGGQAEALHYVPLPPELVKQIEAYWASEFKG